MVTQKLRLETTATRKRLFTRAAKRLRKKTVRNSILAANVLVLFLVFAFVIHNTSSAQVNSQAILSNNGSTSNTSQANPLDKLSSAQIAVQVARMTGIYESTSVANLADSQDAAAKVVASDSQVINKPTVIATSTKSRNDIIKYTTQPGDTVSSLAIKYGVTSNSILWSNSISGDALTAGLSIIIPPVNGIVYTVKAGDTVANLAQKYNSDVSQLTSFNDAEISGITAGEQIVIPNAIAPVTRTASSSSSSSYGGSSYSFGYGPVYGSNGYDYGYCTWWVAQKRAQAGVPVPSNLGNASSWYSLAQSAGIPTGSSAQSGAVLWFGYSANHVAYVQVVASNGDVTISEMNRNGWGVEDTRVIPASQAASYKYIY